MRKLLDWLLHGGLFTEFARVLAGDLEVPVMRELFVPLGATAATAISLALLGRALASRSARWRKRVLLAAGAALVVAWWTFSRAAQQQDHPWHGDSWTWIIPAIPCLAAAALGAGVRASIRLAFALALAGLALAGPAFTAVHGLYMHARGGRMQGGIVIQSSPVTCAPAAMANVLATWGLDVSEGDLAFALRTTVFHGTVLPCVPAHGETLGFTASYHRKTSFAELEDRGLPAILGTFHQGHRPHAVALLGLRDGRVAVADPALGLLCATLDDFEAFAGWQGEAVFVEVGPRATVRPVARVLRARWGDCPKALPAEPIR